MRLTDIAIRNLPAPAKGQTTHYDDSLPGFGVRVSQGGSKSFILIHGATRQRSTIGRYPIIGLADARTEAKRILAERTLGKHQPPTTKMDAALTLFTEQHLTKLAPRTSKEIIRLFNKHLVKLKPKKLAEVTTHDMTGITDKLAPSEAEHLHRACKTFFRWCVRRRLLQHSPLEGLELPSKWKARERVLSDDELRAVWIAAGKQDGVFGDIVKLLILTGQRRGEVVSLQTAWLDIEKQTCTLPSEIAKNRRSHTFPIGGLAVSILETSVMGASLQSSTHLFPARGSDGGKPFNGWSKAKAQLDKTVNILWRDINQTVNPFTSWTLHDLRRTYATNLQRLGIKLEVIEALLNHVSGTRAGIVGVYQRHQYETEMREAVSIFEKWFTATIAPS